MRNIKVLSDREHIYQKTEMYAGGASEIESEHYIIDGGLHKKTLRYVPAVLKIINEVIDNAVDVHIKTPTASKPLVEITMTKDTVSVSDNGCGIPVKQNDDGIWLPRVCWGFARSGGNFDLKENSGLGTFGVGSYITNVLSTKFVGTTCDSKKSYTVAFENNAETFSEAITPSTKSGTTVTFMPDLSRFNITELSDVYIELVKQRLLNLKMAFPQINFKFNKELIKVANFKSYCQQFNLAFESYETDNYSFAIMHNPEDDFQQLSYVNGLHIKDGGTHVDVVTREVVDRLRERLSKKYNDIKPGDIRNKLLVVMFCRNFGNPKFNSQTKEKITNTVADISQYLGDVPWDALSSKIFKNSDIISPITEVYKIKEEMKRRQDLKSLSKVRRIRNEKFLPSTRRSKYLMIVEGECLEENTNVMTATFDTMPIKHLDVGDVLLSREHQETTVKAITKILKPCVDINTSIGKITCGAKHRFYVYDKETKEFSYTEANGLIPGRHCFVRSRINENTKGSMVLQNDGNYLTLDDDTVSYTIDDTFTVLRDGHLCNVAGVNIRAGDVVVFSLETR